MPVFVSCLVFFLAMAGYSSATYCICKDGVSESFLQKDIDYACGAGADCSPILQNGPCYNPNSVKDHCNYAVNSYFQRKGQAAGSCDFAGTATISQTIPTLQNSACVYPSSPSNLGTSPSTNNPSTTPPATTVPSTNPTPTTTTPGSSTTPLFGIGPTGSGSITSTDNTASLTLHQFPNLLSSFAVTLLLPGLIYLRP